VDVNEFYRQLFAPVTAALGPLDEQVLCPVVDFRSGGPLKLCTIGGVRCGGDKCVTYLTCELALLPEQVPSDFGRYELMVSCDSRYWALDVLTGIGRLSLTRTFGHGSMLDIKQWTHDYPLEVIVFERFAMVQVDGSSYGVLRCFGITRAEFDYAQRHGVSALTEKLRQAGIYPKTAIERDSVL
jgi:hypothetical protein